MNNDIKGNAELSVQATIGGRHVVAIVGVAVTGICILALGAMKCGYAFKAGNLLFAPVNSLQSICA